eukprot:COSAG06_NODE_1970_length_7941_cov_5.832568_6_plen_82_part_00
MMLYFAAVSVSVQPETLPVWMIVEALSCQLGGKGGAIGGNGGSESGDGVDDDASCRATIECEATPRSGRRWGRPRGTGPTG